MHCDLIEAGCLFDEGFNVILPERTEWEGEMAPITGFTDGLKAAEGTEAGVFCEELLDLTVSIPLGTHATGCWLRP